MSRPDRRLYKRAYDWAIKGARRNPGIYYVALLPDRLLVAIMVNGKVRGRSYTRIKATTGDDADAADYSAVEETRRGHHQK